MVEPFTMCLTQWGSADKLGVKLNICSVAHDFLMFNICFCKSLYKTLGTATWPCLPINDKTNTWCNRTTYKIVE